MKLLEALELWRRPAQESASGLRLFLACSFTPLHLTPFLGAEVRRLRPDAAIVVQTGLFGDLPGNIARVCSTSTDSAVILLEWHDLDPRLGIRTFGGWKPKALADIIESASNAADRLEEAIRQAANRVPIVLCMPTLPLPPLFSTRPVQGGPWELRLLQRTASLAASLAECSGLRIVNPQVLNETSPLGDRYDPKSDATNGFPYTLSHASKLAELLAALVIDFPSKKGIITDLDDTLWAGIAGEDGVDAVSWSLDRGHLHGVYQQMLASLAGSGTLIAVASKNDPSVVQRVFDRPDLLLGREEVYPFEIGWSRKSESVERILKTWNIGPEAVVFIDDSPMEVAEVQTAFPEMECVVFPKTDHSQLWKLVKHLRDEFGKAVLAEEDSLRLQSIRATAVWQKDRGAVGISADDFLKNCGALIVFERSQAADLRALELLNKTNQFNLNGKRVSEAMWRKVTSDPESVVLSMSYQDKYGPLGKIAVLLGRRSGRSLHIESWVMSCRAFSRRIEHHCLRYLFDELGVSEIQFEYEKTAKNNPVQEFLAELAGSPPGSGVTLSRCDFEAHSPALFHRVEVKNFV